MAEAIANALRIDAPKGLFVIAGSTGATPASRALMQAACELENGLVVLPGLDHDASAEAWAAILDAPDHPQHALAGTMAELGLTPERIPNWPDTDEEAGPAARRRLCLLYTSPSPRDQRGSRMPSSA